MEADGKTNRHDQRIIICALDVENIRAQLFKTNDVVS